MFLYIFSKDIKKLLFSTNLGVYEKVFSKNIKHYFENRLNHTSNFEFRCFNKNNLVLLLVKILSNKFKFKHNIETELNDFLIEFFEYLTEDFISRLMKNNIIGSKKISSILIKEIFSHDISIRILGTPDFIIYALNNYFFGLTFSELSESVFIPYKKTFNQKSIIFREFHGNEATFFGLNSLVREPYNLVVLDWDNNLENIKTNQFIEALKRDKPKNNKILIIINNFDTYNVINPRDIEDLTDYPVEIFNPNAQDAPERFMQIINKFLKERWYNKLL